MKHGVDKPFEMLINVGETDVIGALLRNRRYNMNYAGPKNICCFLTMDLTSTDMGSSNRPGKKLCNMQPSEGKNGVSLISPSRS